jgi:hypothetical protein
MVNIFSTCTKHACNRPIHPFFAKLILVKVLFLLTSHTKILTFKEILSNHKVLYVITPYSNERYKECIVKAPRLVISESKYP